MSMRLPLPALLAACLATGVATWLATRPAAAVPSTRSSRAVEPRLEAVSTGDAVDAQDLAQMEARLRRAMRDELARSEQSRDAHTVQIASDEPAVGERTQPPPSDAEAVVQAHSMLASARARGVITREDSRALSMSFRRLNLADQEAVLASIGALVNSGAVDLEPGSMPPYF